MLKGKKNQIKKIHEIEQTNLSNGKFKNMMTDVLHKGYWKYKPEHYKFFDEEDP